MKKFLLIFLAVLFLLSLGATSLAGPHPGMPGPGGPQPGTPWPEDSHPGYNLTGRWSCNDGGTYYITQSGTDVYWYGEQNPTNPRWSNVGKGKIVGSYLFIETVDVPKGNDLCRCDLILQIKGDTLIRVEKTPGSGFGGSQWSRRRY